MPATTTISSLGRLLCLFLGSLFFANYSVYAQSPTLTVISYERLSNGDIPNQWCAGDEVRVRFTATNVAPNTNALLALEISDGQGFFNLPIRLSTPRNYNPLPEDTFIVGRIPFSIAPGNNYRFRVVGALTGYVSVPSTAGIRIANPIASIRGLNDGLLAYYPLDGFINDQSGNNNNGTAIGGVTPTTDRLNRPNRAMQFNGSNGYVSIPNSPTLMSPVQQITVSTWMYFNFAANNGWIPIGAKSNGSQYGLFAMELNIRNGQLRFDWKGSGGRSVNYDFEYGTWYHLTVTGNDQTLRFYINGRFIGQQQANLGNYNNNMPLEFGRHTPGATEYLNGKLDELRIYNRALSDFEVQLLYNDGIGSSNTPICEGGRLEFTAIDIPGARYLWLGPNGFRSTERNPVIPEVYGERSGIYTVQLTQGDCASQPDTVEVQVSPVIVVDVRNARRCGPGLVTLTALGGADFSYRWYTTETGGSPIPLQFTSNFTVNLNSSSSFYVSTINLDGCEGPRVEARATIVPIPPKPTISTNGEPNVCEGSQITLSAPEGFSRYLWSNGATTQSISVGNAGRFSVRVFNQDCPSPASDSILINVIPKPTLPLARHISFSGNICANTAPAVNLDSTIIGLNYQLVRWPSEASFGNLVAGNGGTISFSLPTLVSSDSFRVKVFNPTTSCQAISGFSFFIGTQIPVVPALSFQTSYCGLDSLQASGIGENNQFYRWQVIENTSNVGISFSDTTLLNSWIRFNHTSQVAATIRLRLTTGLRNLANCTWDTMVAFQILPTPAKPNIISGGPLSFCEGENVVLSGPLGFDGYRWSNGASTREITVSGSAAITLRVRIGNCWSLPSEMVNVIVNPKPSLPTGGNKEVCACSPIAVGSPNTNPEITVSWNPYPGLSDLNSPTPFFNFCSEFSSADTTIYLVRQLLNTTTNCSKTDTISVRVVPQIANVLGADTSTCSSVAVVLNGNNVRGLQYRWEPANYFANPTLANASFTHAISGTNQQIIKVWRTASNGICEATDTMLVTVQPVPSLNNSGLPTIRSYPLCINQDTSFLISNQPTDQRYRWIRRSNNQPLGGWVQPNAAGDLTLSVPALNATEILVIEVEKDWGNGLVCSSVSNQAWRFSYFPRATVSAGDDKLVCSEEVVVLGSNGLNNTRYRWSWQGNNSTVIPLDGPNVPNPRFRVISADTNLNPLVFTVWAAHDSTSSCPVTDTVIVNVKPKPIAPEITIGGSTSFCSGDSVELFAPSGFTSYLWSNGATSRSIWVNNTSTISLKVINQFGCESEAADSVYLTEEPRPFISAGTNITVCNCGPVAIGGLPANPAYRYNWLNSEGVISNDTLAQSNFQYCNFSTEPRNIRLRLIATNRFTGCSSTDSVLITVLPELDTLGNSTLSACSRNIVSLGSQPRPNMTYRWAPASLFGADSLNASSSFSIRNTSSRDTIFTVTRTVANGTCSAVDTILVTITPEPNSIIISGNTNVCPGETNVSYQISQQGNSTPFSSLIVNVDGAINFQQNGNTITVNWGATNNQAALRVIALSNAGCQSEEFVLPVRINPIIRPEVVLEAGRNDSVCLGQNIIRTYSTRFSSISGVYRWTIPSEGRIIGVANQSSITIEWLRAGNFPISVFETIATSLDTCRESSETYTVRIFENPTATDSISGPNKLCFTTEEIEFSVNAIRGSNIRWVVTGNADIASQDEGKVILRLNGSGQLELTAQETTEAGCVGPALQKIIQVNPIPLVALTNADSIICFDDRVGKRYSVLSTLGSTYDWIVTGGEISSGQGTNSITVNFTEGNNATLSVKETASTGCVSQVFSIPIRIDNNKLQLLSIGFNPESEEERVLVNTSGVVGLRNTSIQIKEDGNERVQSISSDLTEVPTTAKEGLSVSASANNSCNKEQTTPAHQAMFLSASGSVKSENITLTWSPYVGWNNLPTYQIYRKEGNSWVFMAEVVDTKVSLPIANDDFKQSFRIKAVYQNLVSWSTMASIELGHEPEIPNVITPNGDGKNDSFIIGKLNLFKDNELVIFDRWGKTLYQQNNYQQDWKAENLPTGTYYYLFRYEQGNKFKRGIIEVLK